MGLRMCMSMSLKGGSLDVRQMSRSTTMAAYTSSPAARAVDHLSFLMQAKLVMTCSSLLRPARPSRHGYRSRCL